MLRSLSGARAGPEHPCVTRRRTIVPEATFARSHRVRSARAACGRMSPTGEPMRLTSGGEAPVVRVVPSRVRVEAVAAQAVEVGEAKAGAGGGVAAVPGIELGRAGPGAAPVGALLQHGVEGGGKSTNGTRSEARPHVWPAQQAAGVAAGNVPELRPKIEPGNHSQRKGAAKPQLGWSADIRARRPQGYCASGQEYPRSSLRPCAPHFFAFK